MGPGIGAGERHVAGGDGDAVRAPLLLGRPLPRGILPGRAWERGASAGLKTGRRDTRTTCHGRPWCTRQSPLLSPLAAAHAMPAMRAYLFSNCGLAKRRFAASGEKLKSRLTGESLDIAHGDSATRTALYGSIFHFLDEVTSSYHAATR